MVLAGVERKARDGFLVAFEVAKIGVIMSREVADGI